MGFPREYLQSNSQIPHHLRLDIVGRWTGSCGRAIRALSIIDGGKDDRWCEE